MSKNTKRYVLVLPQELYDEVEAIANREQVAVVTLLRKFIKLGLIAINLEDDPNSSLVIREDGTEREIILL